MKQVELLAPAGNIQCAMAAINAGANAIYMGASKFSARAYADNLEDDELIRVIRTAHLYGVSVYLTLNILLNDEEIEEVIPLVKPLYENGLDGVIIQDFGVAKILRDNFAGLELHASTQMSIMNSEGAEYISEKGFNRIVPARELTLKEVRKIKEETGLELECFIHGAMCYSYSGMCLMSSVIGGRSGNRGKCAGTCRLPFRVEYQTDGEEYPYSMKDMCTLEIIPDLIEAGIDSFKIEGRMKSPEYVAGVTAMYRKYIDLYNSGGREGFNVSKQDIKDLYSLYIRTDISKGYYYGKKGKNLITIKEPGYNGQDDKLIHSINKKYVHAPEKIPVSIDCTIREGEPLQIMMNTGDFYSYVSGNVVDQAQNQPIGQEKVNALLSRLGDTCFYPETISIDIGQGVFVPMRQINELRRQCTLELENQIIESNGYVTSRSFENTKNTSVTMPKSNSVIQNGLELQVSTAEQFDAVYDLYKDNSLQINRLILNYSVVSQENVQKILSEKDIANETVLSLPAIYRSINEIQFNSIEQFLTKQDYINAILVHGLDEINWVKKHLPAYTIYTDTGVYTHNKQSIDLLNEDTSIKGITIPYELKLSEIYSIQEKLLGTRLSSSLVVYGRIPLMYSDGCIKKTYDRCDKKINYKSPVYITDRYNHSFPVVSDCNICTSITYNDRPLSFIHVFDKIKKIKCNYLRLCFTIEDYMETQTVILGFCTNTPKAKEYLDKCDSTTGHLKRGV